VSVKRTLALATVVIAASAAVAAAGVGSAGPYKRATTTVSVEDDFFSPDRVEIKKRSKVKWVWSEFNGNTHNVVLKKSPKGIKKGDFKSRSAATNYTFKRKFKRAGKYHFVCTFHQGMEMDVAVKKKS
jgi:plastocyanin